MSDRPEFSLEEALEIADRNDDNYKYVPSVSRTLAHAVRQLALERDMLRERNEELEVAVNQAIELAEYVETHAKGAMVDRVRHYLSLAYAEELAADAKIGRIVWSFIDRMDDVAPPVDPAEKILEDFVKAVNPAIEAALFGRRSR